MADPPKFVTMSNGETLFVNGWRPTIRAVRSGAWTNPYTWDLKRIPTNQDNVWIPDPVVVQVYSVCEATNVVCGGTLELLHGFELHYSTITGLPGSHLVAGSLLDRIGGVLFHESTDFDPEDTQQVGNGIVWCGHGHHHAVQIYGYADGSVAETEWTESVAVTNGQRYGTAYVSRGAYEPQPHERAFNLSNSIQFITVGDITPHVMLMHCGGMIEGVSLDGYGRTDKAQVLSATNPAGRYALHFHRGGEVMESRVRRVVSTGAKGWGLVNHSSNVVMEDCIVAGAFGAGFVCEAGNEVGAFRRCAAIDIRSDLVPNPYERQIANDRWHAGEGFALSPRVQLEDCEAIDVGMCFAWQGRGLTESIGGRPPAEAKLEDGTAPQLVTALPPRKLRGSGYSRFGVWSQWKNFRRGMTDITDVVLKHGGPKSQAFRTSYDGGWNVTRATIDGADIASFEESLDHFAEMRFESCDVRNVRQGTESLETSMHRSTWLRCGVRASDVGILCRPSKHPQCQRIYTIEDTTIEAPSPLLLIDPGAPYTEYEAATVRNEVWKDGVRLKYPWQ